MRGPSPLPVLLLALAAASVAVPPPAGAQDSPPAPAPKPPPLDAGLDPEKEILKEARSDPRNLKPDAFPVIRKPVYLSAVEARKMDPDEWVIGVVVGKQAIAFPINVLNFHEILVDVADDIPFLVCWCPLCRTGRVHGRNLDGEVLDFGHSGMLYRSAFLLYDTGTKSLWHHATGRALTGKMRGKRLDPIPSQFVTWDVWRKARPDTRVLAKDPMNLRHTADEFDNRNRLLKLGFALGVVAGGEERMYELSELEKTPLVLEVVGGKHVAVAWKPGLKLATAWERNVEGRILDLRWAEDGPNGLPRLEETGENRSLFDLVTGECVSGPLQGKRLRPVVRCFWETNAWIAHHPRGTVYRASAPPPPDLPEMPPPPPK